MGKYIVTSGSYFQPFTYDELVKPLQQMTDVWNQTQDAYDVINMDSSAIDQYIDKENDPKARELYDSYMNKLRTLQDDLWENGITARTRKYLSDARNGYSKDIKRLQTAVQSRNEKSKAYWDTYHKNPDTIMGIDPGTASLDKYLADENYGSDWYSYSGADFMKEVGTDAQARAAEILRNFKFQKDIPGYITRIVQEGFTNQEIDTAIDAVRNGKAGELTGPEKILADTFASHLESTGARVGENISQEQFDRFYGYGRTGMSQAVTKPIIQDFSDKVWESNQQWANWKRQYDYSHREIPSGGGGRSSGKGSTANNTAPYTLNDISRYLRGKDADVNDKLLDKKFLKPFEHPIVVNVGGVTSNIKSPSDAEAILSSLGKDVIRNYGIDPDSPLGKWDVSDGQGGTTQIRVTRSNGSDKVYVVSVKDKNGKFVPDAAMSESLNDDFYTYRQNLKQFEKDNPGVNLNSLSFTEKDKEKIYKKSGTSTEVPFEYMPYILATKAKPGRITPATIAGSTKDMEGVRENYANNIITSFYNTKRDSKNRVAKSSEYAFYPVDGYDISDKAVRNIEDVLGVPTGTKGKKRLDPSRLREVTILPEDLLKNKVRILVDDGKAYGVDPSMLGNDVDNQVRAMRAPVEDMMTPIFNPEKAVMMSPEESVRWIYTTSILLGESMNLVQADSSGRIVGAVTPRDIVMNPRLQEDLRRAVTIFMNHTIADARDNMMHNNFQQRSNSSSKPEDYNDMYDYYGE